MYFDLDKEVDERRYLILMFALLASEGENFLTFRQVRHLSSESVGSKVDLDEMLSLYNLGLLRVYRADMEIMQERGGSEPGDMETVEITNKGLAVLINAAPWLLDRVIAKFNIPNGVTALLIPLLDVRRVPAADRYVNTADNQEAFAALASELELVKNELIRDQNANELPISMQTKRAMAVELEGLVGQIRAGYVRISDLTIRARPLVKSVADACKDIAIISGAAYAAYEIIGRILNAIL
jgi:hypothetical protein